MLTFIELHLIAYFTLFLFVNLAIKVFMQSKCNLLAIVISSVLFAIIKFLLDFYNVLYLLQILILIIFTMVSFLISFKLNHITKLIVATVIFGLYLLFVGGANWAITLFVFQSQINYISNLYLFFLIGFNFITFATYCMITEYLKSKKPLVLNKKCILFINNDKVVLTGFLDTGNVLKEEKSGKSVVIVSINSIKKYISNKMFADLLFATNSSGEFKDIKKIQYSTISGNNNITVFKPKGFYVDGKKIDCYIGVVFNKINHDVILNVACI